MKIKRLSKTEVCAIIVAYKTDKNDFSKNLNQIKNNYQQILLYNNDPEQNLSEFQSDNVVLINNSTNIGLSKCLNQGIDKASELGFKAVAFFDQDSLIPDDYNHQMLANIHHFQQKYPTRKIASYSALFLNKHSNVLSKIIRLRLLSFHVRTHSKSRYFDFCDWVITSGSYVYLDTLKKLGSFDDQLFIDYLDIEWCLRARFRKYQCITFNNIYFTHSLGDGYFKFLDHYIYMHSPLRLYYSIRNSIYLLRLKHISFNFFIIDQVRNILKILVYLAVDLKNAPKRLGFIVKAIYHAIMGKMGKLEE